MMPHSVPLYRSDIAYHRFMFSFITYSFNIVFIHCAMIYFSLEIITNATEIFTVPHEFCRKRGNKRTMKCLKDETKSKKTLNEMILTSIETQDRSEKERLAC
jgi:hypothetical protein